MCCPESLTTSNIKYTFPMYKPIWVLSLYSSDTLEEK